jgi:3-oxoacyl-[acyl-carrier-protein] synthase-3
MRGVRIAGVGLGLPERVLKNEELENQLGLEAGWIKPRSGIKERRVLAEGEDPILMGVKASKEALGKAQMAFEEIDFLIASQSFPYKLTPGTAIYLAKALAAEYKLHRCSLPCLDLNATCSSFIYGLSLAEDLIKAGSYRKILLVSIEALSRFLDWQDRESCILFGDGAGAAVIVPSDSEGRGILGKALGTDPNLSELAVVEAGGTKMPLAEETLAHDLSILLARRSNLELKERLLFKIQMEGPALLRPAARYLKKCTQEALRKAKLSKEDIDWIVPHQANVRIIDAFAKIMRLPQKKFLLTIEKYGNLSSASIPITLADPEIQAKIRPGDILCLAAFGGGVTYGAVILEW